jgi:hypothetical protein
MHMEMDKKLLFYLLDLLILKSFIPTPCGSEVSHQNFRPALVMHLSQEDRRVPQTQTTPWERLSTSTAQPIRLDL